MIPYFEVLFLMLRMKRNTSLRKDLLGNSEVVNIFESHEFTATKRRSFKLTFPRRKYINNRKIWRLKFLCFYSFAGILKVQGENVVVNQCSLLFRFHFNPLSPLRIELWVDGRRVGYILAFFTPGNINNDRSQGKTARSYTTFLLLFLTKWYWYIPNTFYRYFLV